MKYVLVSGGACTLTMLLILNFDHLQVSLAVWEKALSVGLKNLWHRDFSCFLLIQTRHSLLYWPITQDDWVEDMYTRISPVLTTGD